MCPAFEAILIDENRRKVSGHHHSMKEKSCSWGGLLQPYPGLDQCSLTSLHHLQLLKFQQPAPNILMGSFINFRNIDD